jgi:hypothetical protein
MTLKPEYMRNDLFHRLTGLSAGVIKASLALSRPSGLPEGRLLMTVIFMICHSERQRRISRKAKNSATP